MRAQPDARGGLIRAFSVTGDDTVYREQRTYFSDSDRAYAYRHLSGIKGADSYSARLTVTPRNSGGCVITMTATLAAPAPRAAEIAAGTKAIFDRGIAALAQLAKAEGNPSPAAPPETTDPLAIETLLIDDLPRLAVSVTPNKPGTLCLFLHGIGGERRNWDAQLQAVGPHMRAAALDLRGYGDSTLGAGQSSVEDYCADILRLRAVLGADKLVLVGLSYGAWIATSFAMRHPEMLAGLVLSGGCTGMSEAGPDEREAFRISREVPLNAGQVPAGFAPAVVKVLAGPNAVATMRATLLASMAKIPSNTYRDALMCFTNPLEQFDFSRLTMPVLMMTGQFDRLAPPDEIRGVASRIHDRADRPNVRFETVAEAGHVCNIEAPDQYNRILLEFLSQVVP